MNSSDRTAFLLSVVLLSVGMMLAPVLTPHGSPTNQQFESDRDILERLDARPSLSYLLWNNVSVWISTFVFPLNVLVLVRNGFGIAYLVTGFVRSGATLELAILLTVPHSVFEFASLCLASTVSFRVGHTFIRYYRGRRTDVIARSELVHFARLAIVSAVLLGTAGVFEAYVTPLLATYATSGAITTSGF